MAVAVNQGRVFALNRVPLREGPVIYWMSRDQRADDNWALLYARELALDTASSLAVCFCLVPAFPGSNWRHYDFMLAGLRETAIRLAAKGIPFFLLEGDPLQEIPKFVELYKAGAIVSDFDPLRIKLAWHAKVAKTMKVMFVEVDAHNIVPCRRASPKREYGAYTLRPKLDRLLPGFLTPFPRLKGVPAPWRGCLPKIDWDAVLKRLRVDDSVAPVRWLVQGSCAAKKQLQVFIAGGLKNYAKRSGDPANPVQSELSPYLHFGQISAQRVALEVKAAGVPERAKEAFLEQLIVRRELSDNFCLNCSDYDKPSAFPAWARASLKQHAKDKREYRYTDRQFENGETHDRLWNAAQKTLVVHGKMHNYLRMYWAKKILEWTGSFERAMALCIRLNDWYELDGRDPNGYAGIAWSIGGVHDRPWGERPIFGMIRYMSSNGCKSKFDVEGYIRGAAISGV